jgi:hypothetical protein
VVDYINDYKKGNEEEKRKYFSSFGRYVVTTRWKKNFRRISRWPSHGFMTKLQLLRMDDVRRAFATTVVKFSKQKDSALCKLLVGLPVREFTGHTHRNVHLCHLKDVSKKVRDLGEGKEMECDEQAFLEFHQLVFNTLLGYYKALKTFSDNMKQEAYDVPEGSQQKKLHAIALWDFSYLLWRIAHSRIFRVYMMALGQIDILTLPEERDSSIYEHIMAEHGEKDHGMGPEYKGNKEEGKPEEVVPDEVAAEETEELCRLMIGIDSGPSKNALVYLRWMRLQVSHLAAINILSVFPRKAEVMQDIQISLIAVNYSRPDVTENEPWKDTIRNLACTSTFDAQSAIDIIQKRIDGGDNHPSVLKSFRKEHALSGNMHCEAALASLATYPERAIDPNYPDKGILTRLINVCFHLR